MHRLGGFRGLKGACRPLTSASGQGKAKPCCGHESMLANHPDKRSLYKWALPCFPKCLLRSKILLSISAPRPFSASVPLPCDRRPPLTATGRRRAAQTALWGPDAPKQPQDAGDRPDGHRTPESGPDGSLGARCPQTATGRRRPPLTATGRRRPPLTATGRRRAALFSARSQPLVLDQVGGCGPPPGTPLFLSNPSRACARPRVRARIMRPRARFWPLD